MSFGIELDDEDLDAVTGGREKRKLVDCIVYTVCWYDKDIDGAPYYTEDVFWTEEKAKAFMAEHGGTIEPRHRFRLE